MIHELKAIPPYFGEVWKGWKTFEFRINDRDFMEGDVVVLREFRDGKFTDREVHAIIGYILTPEDFPDVPNGYCIFSIKLPKRVRRGGLYSQG